MTHFEIVPCRTNGAVRVDIYGRQSCYFLSHRDAQAYIDFRVAERLRLALHLFQVGKERGDQRFYAAGLRAMRRYHRARKTWRQAILSHDGHTEIAGVKP